MAYTSTYSVPHFMIAAVQFATVDRLIESLFNIESKNGVSLIV